MPDHHAAMLGGGYPKYVAEAISHESGHVLVRHLQTGAMESLCCSQQRQFSCSLCSLLHITRHITLQGLGHDGNASKPYYEGHGDWAPIMVRSGDA